MTGAQGWVYYNWSMENEANFWGSKLKRTTPGYIAQEIERLKHGRRKSKTDT